jgi:hypothetical protein
MHPKLTLQMNSNAFFISNTNAVTAMNTPNTIRRSSKKQRKSEYYCNVPGCTAILYSKSSRFRHKKLHEQPGNQYRCDQCPASFLVKLDLTDHKRKAHMEKGSFVTCDQCYRTFSSLSNLNAHKEIHQAKGIPQYKCSVCDTAYFHRSALYRHQRNDHGMERSNTTCTVIESDCSSPVQNSYLPPTPTPSPIFTSATIDCSFCTLKMDHVHQFYQHLESAHFLSTEFRCLLNACNHVCETKEELEHHRKNFHSFLIIT